MLGAWGGAPANPIADGGPTGGCCTLPAGGNRGPPGKTPEENAGGPLLTKPLGALERGWGMTGLVAKGGEA